MSVSVMSRCTLHNIRFYRNTLGRWICLKLVDKQGHCDRFTTHLTSTLNSRFCCDLGEASTEVGATSYVYVITSLAYKSVRYYVPSTCHINGRSPLCVTRCPLRCYLCLCNYLYISTYLFVITCISVRTSL